jgi:rubrerythrin
MRPQALPLDLRGAGAFLIGKVPICGAPLKSLEELSESEILALALSNEEEDGRIFADFAYSLAEDYPDTAKLFADMAEEESEHRRQLIDLFVSRFGTHIPLVRRQDVRGNIARKAVWQVRAQGIEAVRRTAASMERDAERFYRQAASRSTDAGIRKLLGDLADAEAGHERRAGESERIHLPGDKRGQEDQDARRRFVVQVIQPGLVGLMDG